MVGTHKQQRPPNWARYLKRRRLPSLGVGFLTYHYAYFIISTLIASGILWGVNKPRGGLAYVDALFLSVSAMTMAGLNTVDLSKLNTFQQFILFFQLLIGSSVFVSCVIVHVRRIAFEKRFSQVATNKPERACHAKDSPDHPACSTTTNEDSGPSESGIPSGGTSNACSLAHRQVKIQDDDHPAHRHTSSHEHPDILEIKPERLTRSQNFHLGGIEYHAVYILSWLVPAYFILFQLIASLGLGAYIARNKANVTWSNGLNPWWVGAFNTVSAFNNSGMSLLDANMIPFQESYYVLFTMALLILAGNTCFPVFLRFIIWLLYRVLPDNTTFTNSKAALKFLLDHPRRCFTHLFPPRHTYFLLGSVLILNITDWLAFEVLNIGIPEIEQLPLAARIWDGLFQAFAIRSGGFYIVPIAATRISLQALYVVMMYIAVYPVVITIRKSNEYINGSLGIYEGDHMEKGGDEITLRSYSKLPKKKFFTTQLKAQLSHDLWFLVFCIWVIVIIEAKRIEADPRHFSVFNIIFEAVSGYGTVGVSTGYPDVNYSFAGTWHPLSKLVMCAVMLRGRHRGLPISLDKAVELPHDNAEYAIEHHSQINHRRSLSSRSA